MCDHKTFESRVMVARLTENDDSDVVTGFTADIHIRCRDCGMPFAFKGLGIGSSPDTPMTSIDRCELRAPIEPEPNGSRWDQ